MSVGSKNPFPELPADDESTRPLEDVPSGPPEVVDTPSSLDAVVTDVTADGAGNGPPEDVDEPSSAPLLDTTGPHPSRATQPAESVSAM